MWDNGGMSEIPHRRCPSCTVEQPLTSFYFRNDRKHGRRASSYCKLCSRKFGQAWRKTHPDTRTSAERRKHLSKEARNAAAKRDYERLKRDPVRLAKSRKTSFARYIRKTYAITLHEYHSRLGAQGHRCAICSTAPSGRNLDVDHDHATGAVRGLLCNNCNVGLGRFLDNPKLLRAALAYLGHPCLTTLQA